MLCLWFLYVLAASSIVVITDADRVDKAIANGILLPTGRFCQGDGAGNSTSFNAVFYSTSNISKWLYPNSKYEEDVFEIDMIHSDSNVNRSWTMRIGKGGQIVSSIGPYGEAIANQANEKAAWNDLVSQSVAVNLLRNERPPYEDYKFYIHGSGPYMTDDGMPPPFYNPQMALDCGSNTENNNQCTIVNWGQQARVPTVHRSDILYYAKYRDCGNGIIEYDQIIHHFGNNSTAKDDIITFANTPWTGVRTSTFTDVLVANKTGSLIHDFPTPSAGGGIGPTHLADTGGFTTFAQNLKLDNTTYDPGFCVMNLTTDNSIITINETTLSSSAISGVDCDTNGSVPFQLVIQTNESARFSTAHADRYDYPVKMNSCNYASSIIHGCRRRNECQLYFVNSRTNYTVPVDAVLHWCFGGTTTYFNSPVVNVSTLNNEFVAGDEILIKYSNDERMAAEDNLALTFVHGTNPEYDDPANNWFRAPSRMNYGTTTAKRDGTVWTTNFIGDIHPGETYFNRKYMITGRLSEMESRASIFIEETFEDLAKMDDLEVGEKITLYYDDDLNSFGAAIGGDNDNNEHECADLEKACVGSSTPKNGFVPLFYITCGESKSYLGSNAYHFIPDTGSLLKPYLCKDEDLSVRPTYKLLGFFPEGSCDVIGDRAYAAELCPEPTDEPTPFPSSSSFLPSAIPSTLPSLSIAPSAAPPPSFAPSRVQSGQPTSLPSLSSVPSGERGGRDVPSKLTTAPSKLRPTSYPTITTPTSVISMTPTLSEQRFSVPIYMVLHGLSEKLEENGSAFSNYQNVTSDTIEDELMNVVKHHPLLELKVVTSIEEQVASTTVLPTRRRNLLKTRDVIMQSQENDDKSQLKIRSLTHVSFKSTSTDHDVISLVGGSFDSEEDQERYIADLQASHSTFVSVTSMDVQISGTTTPPPTDYPTPDDSDYIPYIIIGASVGGVGLILLSLALFARRRKQQADRTPASLVSGEHDHNKVYGTFTLEPPVEALDRTDRRMTEIANGIEGRADSSIGSNGDGDPTVDSVGNEGAAVGLQDSDGDIDGDGDNDVMKEGTYGGESNGLVDDAVDVGSTGSSCYSNTDAGDSIDGTDGDWKGSTEGRDGDQRCINEGMECDADLGNDEGVNSDRSAGNTSDRDNGDDGDNGENDDSIDSADVGFASYSNAAASAAAADDSLDGTDSDWKGSIEGGDRDQICINTRTAVGRIDGMDDPEDAKNNPKECDGDGDERSATDSNDIAHDGSMVSTEGSDATDEMLERGGQKTSADDDEEQQA